MLAIGGVIHPLERALELFAPLRARLSHPGRALSGGEQQMGVLARALISRPRCIVIDEMSLGLAPVIVDRLVATIRQIAGHGIGVLLIDQFATIALELATHAYVVEGRPHPVPRRRRRTPPQPWPAPLRLPRRPSR